MLRKEYTVVVKDRVPVQHEGSTYVETVKAISEISAVEKVSSKLKLSGERYAFRVYKGNLRDNYIRDLINYGDCSKNILESERNFLEEISAIEYTVSSFTLGDLDSKLEGLSLTDLRVLLSKIMYHSYITIRCVTEMDNKFPRQVKELRYTSAVSYKISDVMHNAPLLLTEIPDSKEGNKQLSDEMVQVIRSYTILMVSLSEHTRKTYTLFHFPQGLRRCYEFSIDDYLTESPQ